MPDRRALVEWTVERLSRMTGIPADTIDVHASFADLGISSLQAVELTGDLEDHLGIALDPTIAYEFPSVDALTRELSGMRPS